MREEKSRTIDGVTFSVTQLGFREGRRAFMRLSKSIGPGMTAMLAGAASIKDVQAQGLAAGVGRLIQDVSDEDLEYFAEVFGKVTRYHTGDSSKRPVLKDTDRESLFAGRLMLFFKWLAFAAEVNFADFFAALAESPDDGQGSGDEDERGSSPPES